MDLATLIGTGGGIAIVLFAILIGGDVMAFVDLPSLLIVAGGSLMVTLLRFTLSDAFVALRMGVSIAFTGNRINSRELIQQITEVAKIARKLGPVGLEGLKVKDAFLRKGVQLCADGMSVEVIESALTRERDLYIERLEEGVRLFRVLGEVAPAFGMIGTLVGLIQMFGKMQDPQAIGPGMALALLTTLYGALISNLIALPMADKLAAKLAVEQLNRSLVIEGTLHIQAKTNPDILVEFLNAYLPEHQRLGRAA